jgi:hypothetical protein
VFVEAAGVTREEPEQIVALREDSGSGKHVMVGFNGNSQAFVDIAGSSGTGANACRDYRVNAVISGDPLILSPGQGGE